MLKPAQLYREQLAKKEWETMYDMDYIYFHSWTGGRITPLDDDNYQVHRFVSVDENDNVIGYIGYCVDSPALSVDRFGMMSFDKGNMLFIKDLYQAVYDIFYKYNYQRLEWNCIADNPAIRGYRNFIKRVGGRECGYRRNVTMLLDHKLHDDVMFEILKEEFKPIRRGKEKDV